MSTNSQKKIMNGLRAFGARSVVGRYGAGERDFGRCNLLGPELEAATAGMQYLSCLEHPSCAVYNPLWVDFRFGITGEQDFDWDSYGRCVSISGDDPPAPRDLRGAQLAGIRLPGSYLYPVDFCGANLARCDMRDAQFENCNLQNVNLYMARMDRVLVANCDVRDSILRRAKLYRARLIRTDLRRVTLRQAHCGMLDLLDSDIRGVDLSAVSLMFAS
jgi:uncharacterized protein YjbI with pentapeptide repeats